MFASVLVPIRVVLVVVWIFIMLIPSLIGWGIGIHRLRSGAVCFFFKGLLRILGIRVKVEGAPDTERPLLLISNHASYLDTFILGALLPVSFTPKREVRSWPGIGFLCLMADCVFVERRRTHMQEAREEMAARLKDKKVLCIFPEGTTNDGLHMKPFKSGFFSLAEEHNIPVQPVTVSYTHANGRLIPPEKRSHIAWVGEDTFFTHFLRFMAYKSLDAVVTFHPTQRMAQHGDRKALCHHCETVINATLQQKLLENAA